MMVETNSDYETCIIWYLAFIYFRNGGHLEQSFVISVQQVSRTIQVL